MYTWRAEVSKSVALFPLLAVAIVAGIVGCSGHQTETIVPPGTPAWLKADATLAAANFGDKHPSEIHFFLGRKDKIVMHGNFTCTTCSLKDPGEFWRLRCQAPSW